MSESCEECRFWEGIGDIDGEVRDGFCRRHAPRAALRAREGEAGEVATNWPLTTPSDWCGEFEERDENP
jgi:hypothetical protein